MGSAILDEKVEAGPLGIACNKLGVNEHGCVLGCLLVFDVG